MHFDVLIVGAGHAGAEAAYAAANMGCSSALLTQKKSAIGQMSCNPSIGGIGKSHLVAEVDALGGIMAQAADVAGIHLRVLNRSKGPAVQATRAQSDREIYRKKISSVLQNTPNLTILEAEATEFIIENGKIKGLITACKQTIHANAIVLTTGTFLAGKIHIGTQTTEAGRMGEKPANLLASFLASLGFDRLRLKTGTPPRLHKDSIDFSCLQKQPSDEPRPVFSFINSACVHPQQIDCYLSATNEATHKIINENIALSAMYNGKLVAKGPRYCPSIEDKVMRFADRTEHRIFLEPEGLQSNLIYPNGISNSLPADVQEKIVHSIKGLERAQIVQPGYAIEYDCFNPNTTINQSLECKDYQGLFFAGQINGTTGYEEAAAQGIIAGINAALHTQNKEPFIPDRKSSYLGVLVSDLCQQGIYEPYRMFTSRAENRLYLREKNADQRLTALGRNLGLIDEKRWRIFNERQEKIHKLEQIMHNTKISQHTILLDIEHLPGSLRMNQWLKRPEADIYKIDKSSDQHIDIAKEYDLDLSEQDDYFVLSEVQAKIKYQGYIDRMLKEHEKTQNSATLRLPRDFDFSSISGLTTELVQILSATKPATLGDAERLTGMTPAALGLLLFHINKHTNLASSSSNKQL